MVRPYEIVTFYASRKAADGPEEASVGDCQMIDMLYASSRIHGDVSDFTLLSNLHTKFSALKSPVTIVRFDLDLSGLMLARTIAQTAHISTRTSHQPMALLDTDILINGPLAAAFDGNFDVGVAYRASKKLPINAGVILLDHCQNGAPARFMAKLLKCYQEKYSGDGNWWGDQLALNSLVVKPAGAPVPTDHEIDGLRYRFLDPRTYNYAPKRFWLQQFFAKKGHHILHFKSKGRKEDMRRFFERHIAKTY